MAHIKNSLKLNVISIVITYNVSGGNSGEGDCGARRMLDKRCMCVIS